MKTKDEILERTDRGLNIFKHYLNVSFCVGKNFRNPLYDDRKGSCNIFLDKRNNIYRMKDFGDDRYSGDPFWLVSYLTGIDLRLGFKDILERIINDMNLNLTMNGVSSRMKNLSSIHSSESPYSCFPRNFTTDELSYWEQYGIDESILQKFNVRSLSMVNGRSRSGNSFTIESTNSEPMFGYYITDMNRTFIKLYRPKSSVRFMYLGDKTDNYVFGYPQLPPTGHLLFITGGEKDVMSLTAHGFSAICLNSETAKIPPVLFRELSFRFTKIYVLYDIDETGLRESAMLTDTHPTLRRLILPATSMVGKDISDYFKSHTREDFLKEMFPFYPYLSNLTSVKSDRFLEMLSTHYGITDKGFLTLFPKDKKEEILYLNMLYDNPGGTHETRPFFISCTGTIIDGIIQLQGFCLDTRRQINQSDELIDALDTIMNSPECPNLIIVHDIDLVHDLELPLKLHRMAEYYEIVIVCIASICTYRDDAMCRMLYIQSPHFIDLEKS